MTSSILNVVLSNNKASSAGFNGATSRFLSRKSRSCISAKICAKLPLIPLFATVYSVFLHVSSALASKNSLTCAFGKTTVPISRPSAISPSFCQNPAEVAVKLTALLGKPPLLMQLPPLLAYGLNGLHPSLQEAH